MVSKGPVIPPGGQGWLGSMGYGFPSFPLLCPPSPCTPLHAPAPKELWSSVLSVRPKDKSVVEKGEFRANTGLDVGPEVPQSDAGHGFIYK